MADDFAPPGAPSYWLTRFLILRLLGLVYLVAFLSLAHQVLRLIGVDGLLPAASSLGRLEAHFGSRRAAFLAQPSLFWIAIPDRALLGLAWAGTGVCLASRLITSQRYTKGSIRSCLQVPMSEYSRAARRPPASLPANIQFLRLCGAAHSRNYAQVQIMRSRTVTRSPAPTPEAANAA